MSNESWPSSSSPPPPPPPGSPPPPPAWGSAPPPPNPLGTPAFPAGYQMPTQPPRPAAPVGAYLAIAGAVLLIVGSFLTWFSLLDTDFNGFTGGGAEETRDGPVFVTFGVLFIAFGVTTLLAKRVLAVAIIAVVLAAFAVMAAFVDLGDVTDAKDEFEAMGLDGFETGPGLYVVVLGALLALAGSIVVLAKRRR